MVSNFEPEMQDKDRRYLHVQVGGPAGCIMKDGSKAETSAAELGHALREHDLST
jgi:hypothetical protein